MSVHLHRGAVLLAAFLCALFASAGAYAAGADCPELTALQRVAGYVSGLGFFQGLGAVIAAAGLIYMGRGIIAKVVREQRILLETAAYVVSAAFIASGHWLAADMVLWPVMVGCICFAGALIATTVLHKLQARDPKPLASILMLVWGAVAVYYQLPAVGFLAMMALMTVLGFTIVVRQLSYGFGFEDEASIPAATVAALFILAAYLAIHILVPEAPAAVLVFKPAAFWVSSFVAFIGLLIMSSRYYTGGVNGHYLVMQIYALLSYLVALALAMIFGINPLAGMAGTFLVFYLAAKPLDVPVHGHIAVGAMLTVAGAIMYGAWWYASQHIADVGQYLTLVQ